MAAISEETGARADAGGAVAEADAADEAPSSDEPEDLAGEWRDVLAKARRQAEEAQLAFQRLVEEQQRQRTELERQMRKHFSSWLEHQND